MRRISSAVVALGCWLAAAQGQEVQPEPEPRPELDFLEYLGAWAEEDDEWLAIEEWEKDNAEAEEDAGESESESGEDDESE